MLSAPPIRTSLNYRTLQVLLAIGVVVMVSRQSTSAEMPPFTWSELSTNAGGGKGALQLRTGEILATRTAWRSNGVQIVCARTRDGGRQWEDISFVASDDAPGADLGDGHLLQLPDGNIWCSYRHARTRPGVAGEREYFIRIARSGDAGRTWQPHSVVAESIHDFQKSPDALRGLWATFLLRTRNRELQCYYDDEDTPHREGFFRHQWITMKTWDAKAAAWKNPVPVARAHDPKHLSRDGMPSVVELGRGELLCVFESVQVTPPHANCLRMVTSDDNGKSWSWRSAERRVIYGSAKTNHLSVSPWVAQLLSKKLICVFATEEDRATPTKSGTPPWELPLDVKSIISPDGGRNWSDEAQTIFSRTHRSYAPGLILLRDKSLLVTWLDYEYHDHRAYRGVRSN